MVGLCSHWTMSPTAGPSACLWIFPPREVHRQHAQVSPKFSGSRQDWPLSDLTFMYPTQRWNPQRVQSVALRAQPSGRLVTGVKPVAALDPVLDLRMQRVQGGAEVGSPAPCTWRSGRRESLQGRQGNMKKRQESTRPCLQAAGKDPGEGGAEHLRHS